MKRKTWLMAFVMFGTYGSVGEFLIGALFNLLGHPLWTYYNGLPTSLESFFLFGLFGCLGVGLFRRRYEIIRRYPTGPPVLDRLTNREDIDSESSWIVRGC